MVLILFFSFVSGIVTILSPCILPVLPIILSGSFGGTKDRSKPLGVIFGFIFSFTIFTLLLTTFVKLFGISAEFLRWLSIIVVLAFGVGFLVPAFQVWLEKLFSKLSAFTPRSTKSGFVGGLILGVSLGLLWSPCVGPILASVISLALRGTVGLESFWITLAYSVGTAIPMFAIMIGGQQLLNRFSFIKKNTAKIQKGFGVLMILTAIAIWTNFDRNFQLFILDIFPNYGKNLTSLEDSSTVRQQLNNIFNPKKDSILDRKEKPEGSTLPMYAKAPEIVAGGEWFNSQPLKLADLRGKVVLVDFWTYSCINCQRTIPYLNDWWSKYKDKGLVIIGVHSPEFEFEKQAKNVEIAINDFGIEYPVMQDNDFATWSRYENRYWPTKYLIDKDGTIRYFHFGEGNYPQTERAIQELLKDAGAEDMTMDLKQQDYSISQSTRETYLGFLRLSTLTSPEPVAQNKFQTYSTRPRLGDDKYMLDGEWKISEEYAEPKPGANLFLNFTGAEVFLVMQPTNGGISARVKVYVDDTVQYLGEDSKDGIVTVDSARLYKLVKLPEPSRHVLRLEFLDGNIQAFAFTFQ